MVVSRAPADAVAVLRRFAADDGRIVVRAPCRLPALVTQVEPLRDVVVEIAVARAASFSVIWAASDGGAFPRFRGTLNVRGRDGATHVRLEGSYDDRLTAPAKHGERRLAYRLAQATCRETLACLRARLGGSRPTPG